jgi:hypothetical protein
MTKINGTLLVLLRHVGVWVDRQPLRNHYDWYVSRKSENMRRLLHDVAIFTDHQRG